MANITTVEEKTYRYKVFQFLNHSANSVFYGIATLAAFFYTLVGVKLLNEKELVEVGTTANSLLLTLCGILVGFIWWLHAKNRQTYKPLLSSLLTDEEGLQVGEEKLFTNQTRLFKTIALFKHTNIEKLRRYRLYSLIANIMLGTTMLYIINNYTDATLLGVPTLTAYIVAGTVFVVGIFFSFFTSAAIAKQYDRIVSHMEFDIIVGE